MTILKDMSSSAGVEDAKYAVQRTPSLAALRRPPRPSGTGRKARLNVDHPIGPVPAAPGPGRADQRRIQYICWIGFTLAAFMAAAILR